MFRGERVGDCPQKWDKQALRAEIRARKAAFGPEALSESSRQIIAGLENLPVFREAKILLLYHSLPDEVSTHECLLRHCSDKEILLPRVVGDDLELRRFTGPDDLRRGAYGILEPDGALFTDYARIQLAVVPGMAFDDAGHRLGRGRGYYDRLFSASAFSQVYKLGLCFPFQLVREVPAGPFDVTMSAVFSGHTPAR